MIDQGVALLLIVLLPLLAAGLGYAWPGLKPRQAGWLAIGSLLVSAFLGLQLLFTGAAATFTRPWFMLPDWSIVLGSQGDLQGLAIPFQLDANIVQLLFLLTTALISAAVLVYALREREGDPRARQFFATLTLFAGSMLLFVAADTLLLLYLAWELMGVCSYLLIAHPGTAEARRSARQAFWTTRATDTGLLFAVLLLLMRFKWPTLSSIDIPAMLQAVQTQTQDIAPYLGLLGLAAMLILFACIGKAAQLPLSFWLPDAMVAPAPVSALLHAATMVAAGPLLLINTHKLFAASQPALLLCVLVGGLTLVLGGVMALCAVEPKRVLAYSTVSQLGLVVLSIGVLAEEAGLYHLLAHAWFKAALFLAVGYLVIQGLARDSQPGEAGHGLLEHLRGAALNPLLRWTLILAGLSLAGAWPLAGALGKEQVLHALLTRAAAEPNPGVRLGEQYGLAALGWRIGAVLFLLAIPITAAYITRLVSILCTKPLPRPAATSEAEPDANLGGFGLAQRGWQPGLVSALMLAVMGSVLGALAFLPYKLNMSEETAAWKWGETFSVGGMCELLLSQVLVWGAVFVTWQCYAAEPRPAWAKGFARFAGLARFFRDGMYLREFFTRLIGGTGWFLALLAGRAEVGLLDWLVLRCGVVGRLLAALARWADDNVVGGARRVFCGLAWFCKHWHARLLQTGNIQHYIFIILLAAVALCFAALGPLSQRLIQILGSR